MEWLNEGPGRMSHRRELREEAIRMCRDVHAGTLHMRDRADEYLPQFPKEEEWVYRRRVNASVLFNAYDRTTGGLVGMVMRKAPAPVERPADDMAEVLEDVDRAGRDLATFASDLFEEAWIDGHAIIFVDKPPVPEGATADETRGIRPYFVIVRAEDVLGYETERRGGKDVVVSIRWRESRVAKAADDEFHEKVVPRVREYRLTSDAEGRTRVEWRVWELSEESKKRVWRLVGDEGGMLGSQMDEIPVSAVYTGRLGTLDSSPPLLDLAAENIRHFQKLSDKDNAEHIGCMPIFTVIGGKEVNTVRVGPSVGLSLPAGATAQYVETSGSGSETMRQSLKDSEHRMALLGLSMLHSESRAAETATSKRIDKSESDSQLAVAATSLEKALNRAFELYAKWEGDSEPLMVAVNRDFENLLLDAQMVQVLSELVSSNKLSLETLWDRLQQGEVLPETFDPDVERERLEVQDAQVLAAVRRLMDPEDAAMDDE